MVSAVQMRPSEPVASVRTDIDKLVRASFAIDSEVCSLLVRS
jgi:hypothetical protein